MSVTSSLNPDVVLTKLDKVFYQNFNILQGMGIATVETPAVFKQDTMDSSAVITEVFKGSGLWTLRGEQEDVKEGTPKVGNMQTFTATNYDKSLRISKNFFDDNKHGVYERMVADMGNKGRITKTNNGFALFRNAFTTTLTADGVALISASHTTLGGETVSNILSSSPLTESTLNDAIVKLSEMKDQDGVICGSEPTTLLVPQALYQKALIAVGSALRSGTANNDMNTFNKYGITVYASPYLGAAAGGSDTAWFLLGRNHSITRFVRQGITTDLVDYKYQANNDYIYKGGFREVCGAVDYIDVVGATGI